MNYVFNMKYILILLVIILQMNVAAAQNVLKVGYLNDTGFVDEDWDGHLTGYGYEFMEFLSNYGNWEFKYIPADTWDELGQMLQSGEIDIMPTMPGDYHLIPNSVRTEHVVGRFPMQLITKDVKPSAHMRIGALSYDYPVPSLPIIAKNEGFDYEIVTFTNHFDMLAAFENNEIDAFIEAMVSMESNLNVLAIFDRQSYRLLVSANKPELLNQLNLAMDAMLLHQPDMRDRLSRKYIRNKGLPLILNKQEYEYLAEKKKLKTTFIVHRKPYAYFENGEAKGAIPEILRKIASDLGVEIEFIEAESPNEARQLVREGKVDFIADCVCDYSQAAISNMNPTQPYLTLSYVPVKRKDFNGAFKTAAAVQELLYTKSYIELHFNKENIVYMPSVKECFQAVADGRADVTFVPASEFMFYAQDTDSYNLKPMAESYFTDDICFGVYNGSDPHLWHILNREIAHLDTNWLRSVVNNTVQSGFHFSPKFFIFNYPLHILGLILFLSSGLIFGIWYRNRMKRKHLDIIQHMAYTDARYDLPNLAWLESEVPQYMIKMRMGHSKLRLYVVVFAMDSKAAIVDQYGEDLLIKHMQKMSKSLNEQPWVAMSAAGINAGHLICICPAEDAAQINNYINESLTEYSYIETKDSRIWLHMKAGICELKQDDFSVRQVVEKASVACYESSMHDVQVFDDKMQDNLTLQHKIESHMEKALELGEFKAWLQPKYDIKTRRIVGAEALVRWTSSELGFMPPGAFIPLFEKNGFVIPVDYSILEQVCQYQKERLEAGLEVVPISVNQSRLHMTEEGYLEKIKTIIEKYDINPAGTIELEITETVFGDIDEGIGQQRARGIINSLHEMGFTISVDDFGSGYSSYMMLSNLPLDVMKIDRTLLVNSGETKRMKNILENVINLGKTLNMQVICEGIETTEQEQLLLSLGCHYGQGYLNAKPMPIDDFTKFVDKRNSEVA